MLSNEDIENDKLLEMMESTPTFRRDQQFKNTIRAMQSGDTNVFPAEPKAPQKPSNTISFDD